MPIQQQIQQAETQEDLLQNNWVRHMRFIPFQTFRTFNQRFIYEEQYNNKEWEEAWKFDSNSFRRLNFFLFGEKSKGTSILRIKEIFGQEYQKEYNEQLDFTIFCNWYRECDAIYNLTAEEFMGLYLPHAWHSCLANHATHVNDIPVLLTVPSPIEEEKYETVDIETLAQKQYDQANRDCKKLISYLRKQAAILADLDLTKPQDLSVLGEAYTKFGHLMYKDIAG